MSYASEVLADTPSLWWRLGDATGTTAADSSGNSRAGTYVGAPTLGTAGLIAAGTDTAVTLNGTSQYISRADEAAVSLGNTFTLEAWVKPTKAATKMPIFAKDSVKDEWGMNLTAAGALEVWLREGGGETYRLAVGGAWSVNNVFHLVGVKTSTQLLTYINGVEVGAPVAASVAPLDWTSSLWVGNGAAGFFQGVIDEAAIYPTALSAARVAAHYRAALLPRPGSRSLMGVGR